MTLPEEEYFNFKDCVIAGDDCWLITPKDIKTKWNEDILHFRSLIIRKSDHHVVSSGFRKFFNLSEQPDIDPFPDGPFSAYEKHDGSLLICSYYMGTDGSEEYIFRTRGTSSVSTLDNGHELEFLLEKYPRLKSSMKLNQGYSILCEWETPTQPIVLNRVNEPTLTLIGAIRHSNFTYLSQEELDRISIDWEIERPSIYHYNSIKECVEDVTNWKGKEGVVLYSDNGQHFRKIKGEEYLNLHKILTGYKTINSYLDLFMTTEKFAKYSDFFSYVERCVDYEVAERGKDEIRQICTAYGKVLYGLNVVKKVVDQHRTGFSRKEQALVFKDHWTDWRITSAFQYLDKNEIDDKTIRKGIEKKLGL